MINLSIIVHVGSLLLSLMRVKNIECGGTNNNAISKK
jgi:hypothetical protein